MQQQYFDRMLDEIYGAFGRSRPTYNTPAYKSLWRRISEERLVPDEAAKAIAHAMSERDSFPANPGKAILEEFSHWLDRNPQLKGNAQCCAECSADIPGWFWAWDDAGKRMVFKCSCNKNENFKHIQAYTRKHAIGMGYDLGVQDLDYWREQVRLWREGKPYARPCGFTGVVGRKEEPMREDHRRELAYNEVF